MLLIDISKLQKVDKPKANVCVLYIKYKDKNITDVQWFSLGTPVSSTNKSDNHDIAEILLKVALNTVIPSWCPRCIGKCPSNSPFLKNNGAEAHCF